MRRGNDWESLLQTVKTRYLIIQAGIMKDHRRAEQVTWLFQWAALLLAAFAGLRQLAPPAAPNYSPDSAFSVERAFDLMERISQEPHPIGSTANEKVRAEIISQLELLGLDAEIQTSEAPDYFGSPTGRIEIANVVARIPGTASTAAVALVGHYDTDPQTPGANDDGGAVAILLESARALLAGEPLQNDVLLVFIDGEEPAPRFGSRAFVSEHPSAGEIGFVINLEAIGSGGPSTMIGMNGAGGWLIDQYALSAPYPSAYSFITTMTDLIGGSNTDFATFRDAGVPGLEFAYLHGSPIYHTAKDTPGNVSLRSLYQHGANSLALTRHFGNLALPSADSEEGKVFFNIGRSFVMRYPDAWSVPAAFLACILLAAADWRLHRRFRFLRSALLTLAMMTGACVAAVFIWTRISALRSQMSIPESYGYLAALAALTALFVWMIARIAKRQKAREPDAVGVMVIWCLFALLTAFAAPGMSYIFLLPALTGNAALLLRTFKAIHARWHAIVFLVVMATAIVVVLPAVDIFYQFGQPRPGNPDSELFFMIAVPILLLAMLFELWRSLSFQAVSKPSPHLPNASTSSFKIVE